MSMWSRMANVFRGDRLSREIEEEMRAHIDEAIAGGRDPEEARRAFGPLPRQREAGRAIRVSGWLDSLKWDLVFGWRQLLRNRATTVAAVFSLALAMGSCIAAFQLIDALLWRPLPVAHADRLYALSRRFIGFDGKLNEYDAWATPAFSLMRAAVKGQAELIAVSFPHRADLACAPDAEMEKAEVQYVSGWMFSTFGLRPTLGRLLAADDDRIPNAAPYAVLSWDYWNHRFGRDAGIVGRTVHIGDRAYEIVGVGPPSFTGTERGIVTDIFLPLMMSPLVNQRHVVWQRTLVMVNPGVPIEPLRQKLAAVSRAFELERAREFRGMNPQSVARYLDQQVIMKPANAGVSDIQQDYRRALGILGLLVAIVLLIACVNVANLMTAQAASRANEMALRISIGAGRRRLVQLILAQSAILAVLASVPGALFAVWSAPFVLGMIESPDSPVRLDLSADLHVALFVAGLLGGVLVLLGLLPALRASSVRPVTALKGGENPHAPRRLMRGAMALQVAFCFLVVFISSLFVATFQRLSHRPLGFSPDRLLLLDTVAQKGQPPVTWNQAAEALRSVPGVESVAISAWPLLDGNAWHGFISLNGAPPAPTPAFFLNVSPGWLQTMDIAMLQGRDFRPEETTPGAAIVSETFAQTFFPGQNPIGKTFLRGTDQGSFRIVGQVRDTPYRSLREPVLPVAYVPFQQTDAAGAFRPEQRDTFVVRTIAANPLALASAVRRTVADLHTGLRVSNIRTQAGLVRDQTLRERLLAVLAGFFAVVALLLAGVGLYGVLNYSIVRRRREIGIRLAVGSPRTGIVRLVTAETAATVAVGACLGLALGLACSRYVGALLFEVKGTDADALALPALVILCTTILATLPPVVRALHTDPTEILRVE